MTTGNQNNIAIVISAEDRASKKVQTLSQSLRKNLGSSLRSAALSMISFTTVLSAVGLSITGIAVLVKNFISEVRNSNRSLAIMETRLQTSGFSADRAAASVERLRNNLSRTATAALPSLTDASFDFIRSLGGPALKDFGDTAASLAKITGVDLKLAMEALAQANLGNFEPLNKLTRLNIQNRDQVYPQLIQLIENYTQSLSALDKVLRVLGQGWEFVKQAVIDYLEAKAQVLVDAVNDAKTIIAFFKALSEIDVSALIQAGIRWAKVLVISFFDWMLGQDAADIVRLALVGNWKAAWNKLSKDVVKWAAQVWQGFQDGGREFLDQNWVQWLATNIWTPTLKFFTDLIPTIFATGQAWAFSLAQGIRDGVNKWFADVLDTVDRWVKRILDSIARVPGRFRGSLNNGTSSRSSQAPAPQSASRFSPASQAPLSINVNGRQFASAVVEVMNGQIRVREPGLGMV